jgi:hypothetical protein
MECPSPQDTPEVKKILAQVATLASVRNSAFDDEEETRRKLNAHGIPDDEIARQLATLKSNSANSTAVLTSYSLLHSLQHLDAILDRSPRRSLSAEAVVSLFRCAEVCLYNIGVLSTKMRTNVEGGHLGLAMANARWRAGFHEVLYRLSSLVVEVGENDPAGSFLDIRHSPIFEAYARKRDDLKQWLMADWTEDESSIFGRDLDDPQRYVFFSESVNSSDERVWLSRLSRVRLPGEPQEPGESDEAFYERVVCSDEIQAMLEALETEADTDLLSFRAVHQIAEIIACHINRHLCDVIVQLVWSRSGRLDSALRTLVVSNRMLAVVDDAIKLLMRALTPRAYKEIRPNLGMVRGTSSVVLRKTLFNSTYPLLVRAFKLRICEFSPELAGDDEAIGARAIAILDGGDADSRQYAEMMRQLIVFHQHIRTWRDNHHQLPKTHLGISPVQGQPTVSLSGSDSAVDIAHGLRKIHAFDPITPLYMAALGTPPPDVHELLEPGGFDEHMAHSTARAVFEVYGDVQTRYQERVRRKTEQ